jgi:hypothetical protein
MTVSYVIIIIIIWQKGSVNGKDETSNGTNQKSRFRQLISSKRSTLSGIKTNFLIHFFIFSDYR